MADARDVRGAADPQDLNRFVEAQRDDYEQALAEIREGRKQTHWMWYIFPQFDGLGFSSTSRRYAIKSPRRPRRTWTTPSSARGSWNVPKRPCGSTGDRLTRSSAPRMT
jgi:hypothetical protein